MGSSGDRGLDPAPKEVGGGTSDPNRGLPDTTRAPSRPGGDPSGTEPPARPSTQGASSPWLHAAAVVVGTRVFFFVLAWAASFLLATDTRGVPEQGFFQIWDRWDASRFLVTAEVGYEGEGSFANSYAFFPLFPLSIRFLGLFGVPPLAGGLLISALGSWVALAFLYKLAAEELDPESGRRAVIYLAIFPTAVFLIAPYSESLFLAGAIPAFYFARRRSWHLVGPFAALAMGTRFAGAFLLIGLTVEAIRQKGLQPIQRATAGLAIVVGAVPLLAYGAYLSQAKNDPFYFVTDQRLGWGREFVGPVAALTNTIDRWDSPTESVPFQLAYRIEVLAAVLGLFLVAWAVRKKEWGYAAYMGTTLVVLITSTVYFSVPRILLTFFPCCVFLAQWTRSHPRVHDLYLMGTATLAAVGVIVYTRGAWFF